MLADIIWDYLKNNPDVLVVGTARIDRKALEKNMLYSIFLCPKEEIWEAKKLNIILEDLLEYLPNSQDLFHHRRFKRQRDYLLFGKLYFLSNQEESHERKTANTEPNIIVSLFPSRRIAQEAKESFWSLYEVNPKGKGAKGVFSGAEIPEAHRDHPWDWRSSWIGESILKIKSFISLDF